MQKKRFRLRRLSVLLTVSVLLSGLLQVGSPSAYAIETDIPSLHSVFNGYFPVGVAVEPNRLDTSDPHEALVAKHYNSLVAENVMKWKAIEPTEGNFTFAEADKILDYAKAHNMKVRVHALLYHHSLPSWVYKDANGNTVTRDVLLGRVKRHIDAMIDHFNQPQYKGIVDRYDVGRTTATRWINSIPLSDRISSRKRSSIRRPPWRATTIRPRCS